MTFYKQTDSAASSKIRRLLVASAAALILAACNNADGPKTDTGKTTTPGASVAGLYEVEGDHAIGNPDAKAVVVEYASVVCPACANWHGSVYSDLKKDYIDTGKVRFIFREYPTAPENLARAGFLLANCADEDKFFDNISLQFNRQKQIFAAARTGKVLDEYISLARTAGLSEEEFKACLVNEAETEKLEAVFKRGYEDGVTSTPSFFLNGEKLEGTWALEDFAEKLAPVLGEPVPEKDKEEEEE